jgi:hypothetical protein
MNAYSTVPPSLILTGIDCSQIIEADTESDHIAQLTAFYPIHGVLVEKQVQLEAVVRPRPEFHLARLAIKREVEDVDGTCRFEYGRWHPRDHTGILYDGHCLSMFRESNVGAASNNNNKISQSCFTIANH